MAALGFHHECFTVDLMVVSLRGVFAESAPTMQLESWIQEAHHGLTAAEVSKIIQRVSEVTERTYLAYADEPLTVSHDSLDTSALTPHF